jgi:hypothetical protein
MSLSVASLHLPRRELLTPRARPRRPCLKSWADALRARASLGSSGDEHPAERAATIVGWLNQAALIEVYFGRRDRARAICEFAIDWLEQLFAVSGEPLVPRFVFQPLINVGRLHDRLGEIDQALDVFRTIGRALRGEPTVVRGIVLDRTAMSALLARDERLRETLRTAHIVDTLQTLLRARRDSEAEAFCAQHDQVEPDLLAFVDEGLLIVGVAAKPHAATQLLAARQATAGVRNGLVMGIRCVECLMATRRFQDSFALARRLFEKVEAARDRLDVPELTAVVYLARILGAFDASHGLSATSVLLPRADAIGDVPLQCELLAMQGELGLPGAMEESVNRRRDAWYGLAAEPPNLLQGAGRRHLDATFAVLEDAAHDVVRCRLPRASA